MTGAVSRATAPAAGPRKALLDRLKREPDRSLAELAHGMGVTKPAALRHLTELEREGWVERGRRVGKVGRPSAVFRLTPRARSLFPQAYASMSVCALRFIERRLGRPGVVALLRERAREIREHEGARFQGGALPERVAELVRLREEGGYMAEQGARRGSTFEVQEHNCPILALAEQYGEACEEEQRLFEQLLRARVDVTHRVVAGDPVCRFLIRPEGRSS